LAIYVSALSEIEMSSDTINKKTHPIPSLESPQYINHLTRVVKEHSIIRREREREGERVARRVIRKKQYII